MISDTVITIGDSKSALLYNKHIVPLDHQLETVVYNYPTVLRNGKVLEEDVRVIFSETFLPKPLRTKEFLDQLFEVSKDLLLWRIATTDQIDIQKKLDVLSDFGETIASVEDRVFPVLGTFVHKYDLRDVPVELDEKSTGLDSGPRDTISILIPKIIDPENLTWDKVIEFRKDERSMRMLSRFRSFVYNNYQGKPVSFVEDDILTRIDDYESTIRSWGFETKQGTLNLVLNSRALAAGAVGTFVSALASMPLVAIAAAGSGLAVEIGKIIIHLRGRQFAFKSMAETHPISYLASIRQLEIPENTESSRGHNS